MEDPKLESIDPKIGIRMKEEQFRIMEDPRADEERAVRIWGKGSPFSKENPYTTNLRRKGRRYWEICRKMEERRCCTRI